MSTITITGGRPLRGVLRVQGAKNSALPLLAAALLPAAGETRLFNCPAIHDVAVCLRMLRRLGCRVGQSQGVVTVDAAGAAGWELAEEDMREMRSSVLFLAPLLARFGEAEITLPGGCELGPRPIDFHLNALRQMGMEWEESHGRLLCRVPRRRLTGCEILLPLPSVGATENVLLAAVTAAGQTVVHNAAREPEIAELARFLNRCGAKIAGAGEGTLYIEGVRALHGESYTVMPDRIAAATYMAAVAVTGGDAVLEDVSVPHIYPTLPAFLQCGCRVNVEDRRLRLTAPARLRPVPYLVTGAFPGFPTDAQPLLMAMAAVAEGTSVFVETVFENRYRHAPELCRLGAGVRVEGRMAVVQGVQTLSGARVRAPDLRGGAALVVAALAAAGQTTVENARYIDRGYEDLAGALAALGAEAARTD